MKKKIYLGLLLLSVPLFLTACTPKNSGSNQSNRENEVSTKEENVSESEDLKGSLADLVKLGKNVKCTFEFENEDGKSTGETYVSGNKARSEFSMETSEGEKVNSYSIMDGEWMYTWSTVSDQGTKIKISELESQPSSEDISKEDEIKYTDYKNEFDYKCKVWIPDNSKFTPPTDVTFTDLTEVMNSFMDPSNKSGLCGMCGSLENADEVSQCKERLGCE